MKSVPTELSNAIRSGYVLNATPRLIADWNMNRYAAPVADNVPSEESNGYDVEMFPIESIVEPIRPTKGICKVRINEGTVSDDYGMDEAVDIRASDARFYIGDIDDVYKYWTAPNQSDATGAITECEPFVLYTNDVTINKIVVKLENSWASPKDFTIQITTDGTNWSTVSTNPPIGNDGQVVVYYNGVGWSSTRPDDVSKLKTIRGIKLTVTTLTGGKDGKGTPTTYLVQNDTTATYDLFTTDGTNSNFNLIALEAHLEADLSKYVISTEDTFDTSDVSELYPIGTLTSNGGTLSLSNTDSIFDKDNISSPYAGLLEPNVEFNLEYVYNVDGTQYPVQQFKMYGAEWTGQTTDTVSIDLTDASKYLQTTTPNAAMWEGLTVPQIIWRLMDSVGFVDYAIDADDRVVQHTVPTFWVDGTKSVWEVLDDLAKGTQTAIYFDSTGTMQVKTRETAFDNAADAQWTLRGENSGDELADIIEWSQTEEFEANYITVDYATTKWADFNNGQPTLQQCWTPDGTVTLRASALTTSLGLNDTYLFIPQKDAVYWLFDGMVQIEGELISYKGKQYVYYTGDDGATRNVIDLTSQDEQTQTDAKTPEQYRYKNHLTGALKITERGVWNSEAKAHSVDASGYSVRNIAKGVKRSNVAGFKQDKSLSIVTLTNSPRMKKANDLLVATRGATDDTGFYVYGTMIKFEKEKGRTTQRAGMVIHSAAGEDGYYIELTPTKNLGGKERKHRNELIFYSRVSGKDKRIGGKGTALAIAEEVWYQMDIWYTPQGNDHKISIYINGKNCLTVTVSGGNKNAWNGRFGMMLRGQTKASFEYLYAIARVEVQPEDDVSFFDMVRGGYTGGQWDREWVYSWKTRTRRVKKKSVKEQYRYNNMFMDEFGPFVHEVREYDVKFDPKPIQFSRLYMTNDWNAICTEYRSTPFGAHFVLANAGRTNAVLNGDDSIEYSSLSRDVTQILTVLGRALVISDAENVIAKTDSAIQRRGKIEAELSSDWIQSKDMAQDIADWICAHWGTGADSASVTVFGNPLIEIGDVVDVAYAHKFMTPETHRYFVTGVSTSFDTGVNTTLTLRRVV